MKLVVRFCRSGRYDRLRVLAFDRIPVHLWAMRLAHPEDAAFVEGQSSVSVDKYAQLTAGTGMSTLDTVSIARESRVVARRPDRV